MDQHEKNLVAQSHDPAIAARIIRNIANVESDWHLASDLLSERMMREVRALVAKLTPKEWKVADSGWSALIVPPDWKMTKGVGKGDAWLEIVEFCDAEDEYSWIAAAIGVGSTKMGLELVFRNGLLPLAQKVFANDKALDALLKLGFVRNEAKDQLFLPVKVSGDLLAKGWEENDLDKALAPIGKAVELAISAKAELDKIVEQVRAAAKLK
ncbi:MAG TPA: hypothetical protein PKC48_10340 [Sphingorhabdus sp.]|uniref:hypothetical protein n=1 Tax=Sphingorhabdus sp. TaxID=1902408 RepID=UPI002BC221D7|nr:hypothetical protein [Sphingorhabdus sp.]HMT42698.1 hypothetical protein [Sphingorhabdus sp.]HMU22681.1 hypothetical protein [Sphingorhabdus sp.]